MKYILNYLKYLLNSIKLAINDELGPFHFMYHACALSFFTILCFVPMVVILTTIIPYIAINTNEILSSLSSLIPEIAFSFQEIITGIPNILFVKRKLFGIISFMLIYLTASSFFVAFHRTLMSIFERESQRRERIIIYLVAIPLFIVSLFILYLGGAIINTLMYVLYHIPIISQLLSDTFLALVINIGNLIHIFTIFFLIFSCYHLLVPRQSKSILHSTSMSLVLSVMFILLKQFFTYFIKLATALNPIYGAFGGVFGCLAWIMLSFFVMLVGARALYYLEINYKKEST